MSIQENIVTSTTDSTPPPVARRVTLDWAEIYLEDDFEDIHGPADSSSWLASGKLYIQFVNNIFLMILSYS